MYFCLVENQTPEQVKNKTVQGHEAKKFSHS